MGKKLMSFVSFTDILNYVETMQTSMQKFKKDNMFVKEKCLD